MKCMGRGDGEEMGETGKGKDRAVLTLKRVHSSPVRYSVEGSERLSASDPLPSSLWVTTCNSDTPRH